jgi:hypothetical protein
MKFTDHIIQAIKGRKVLMYLVTSLLVFTAGLTITTDRLPTVVTGLLAAYTALVVTHTASDISGSKKAP